MKIKILIINFIMAVIFLYISELVCFNFIYGDLYSALHKISTLHIKHLTYNIHKDDDFLYFNTQYYNRRIVDIKPTNKKRPILFFGCSYTYGYGIENEDTLPYKFSKYTGRKVNNTGENGAGPDYVYRVVNVMKRDNLFNDDKYEYAIYTFMFNQIKRMTPYMLSEYITLKREKQKNNSFVDKLKYYMDKLYTVKILQCKYFITKKENLFEYTTYIIKEINKMLKEEISDIKLVLLLYNDCSSTDRTPAERESLRTSSWEHLKDDGIIVINTLDLVGDILTNQEYQINEGEGAIMPQHPNGKAWDKIVPSLAKALNI